MVCWAVQLSDAFMGMGMEGCAEGQADVSSQGNRDLKTRVSQCPASIREVQRGGKREGPAAREATGKVGLGVDIVHLMLKETGSVRMFRHTKAAVQCG